MSTLKPYAVPTLVFGILLASAVSAQAATLRVTTTEDSYDGTCNSHCSLRDAVTAANRRSGTDRIVLLDGTYELNRENPLDEDGNPNEEDRNRRGDLDVTGKLLISGTSLAESVISGLINDRLFEVRAGAQLTLERLTLRGGNSVKNGGAVENHGALELREVLVKDNNVTPWEPGWGVGDRFNDGRGGGIANYGKLIVTKSQFRSNRANGLYNDYQSGYGGAIYSNGSMLIEDSLFQENSGYVAGSAIYSTGLARIERSSILDHPVVAEGGAITNEGGTLYLLNSTLSGNRFSLTNGYLDEMPEQSKAILTNVTITRDLCEHNYYCYQAVVNGGSLRIYNSIIAGNRSIMRGTERPNNCNNVGRNYRYQAVGLLINDEPNDCTGDIYVPLAETFTRVLSEQLQNENERVAVHPLLPGSPAVDAGIGTCIDHDQRGVSRPQDGNGDGLAVCDLGAYELKP